MNEQINKLLIRDFYKSILKMVDDNIIIETHIIERELEKNTVVTYLLSNHKEYFDDTLLLLRQDDTIDKLNLFIKRRNDIQYYGQIKYELGNWSVENNGLNLLLGIIFDLQSLILN